MTQGPELSDADFLRSLVDGLKDVLTVAQYERVQEIAKLLSTTLSAVDRDSRLLEFLIDHLIEGSAPITVTLRTDTTDGWPAWSAKCDGKFGFPEGLAYGSRAALDSLMNQFQKKEPRG